MKKTIYSLSILFLLLLSCPGWAADAHHPAEVAPSTGSNTSATVDNAQQSVEKLDVAMNQLMEMRQKIHDTNDPVMRQELMHQYMMKMHSGMNMMSMMGGMHVMGGNKSMMQQADPGAMPMNNKMGMMTGSDGSMMMHGRKEYPAWSKCMMMEKKMEMMQEMMNGMLMMQEMHLKTVQQ